MVHTCTHVLQSILTLLPTSICYHRSVLITCSSKSVDTPCFGKEGGAHAIVGDGVRSDPHGRWWLWGLDEGGRVEPPLDSADNDTHSVGVAIDYTSQETVPIGQYYTRYCT